MWDCDVCGCQSIAGSVTFCPQCYTPRAQEVTTEEPGGESAEARSAALSLPDGPTPSEGTPDAVNPESAALRAAPKPAPPRAAGGSGDIPAAKEWGRS